MESVPLQSWGSVTTKWSTAFIAAGARFETTVCPRLPPSVSPLPPEEEGGAGRPSLGWPPVRSTAGQRLAMGRQRCSQLAAPGRQLAPVGLGSGETERAVAGGDSFGAHVNSQFLVSQSY